MRKIAFEEKVRSDAAMGRAAVADKKKRANQANTQRLQAGKIKHPAD